jgi:hypothetical protein
MSVCAAPEMANRINDKVEKCLKFGIYSTQYILAEKTILYTGFGLEQGIACG